MLFVGLYYLLVIVEPEVFDALVAHLRMGELQLLVPEEGHQWMHPFLVLLLFLEEGFVPGSNLLFGQFAVRLVLFVRHQIERL